MIENAVVNFLMTVAPGVFGAAFIFFALPVLYRSIRKLVSGELDETDAFVVRIIRGIGVMVLAGVLVAGLVSPTVVPKNTVGDPAAQIKKIETIDSTREVPVPGELVDNTRKSKSTDEERKALFDAMVDYKK